MISLVGAGRFERPTPCAQGRCATRLRYAPTSEASLILNHFSIEHPFRYPLSTSKRIKTVSKPRSLHLHRIKTLRFVSLPVDLLERLAFHLQLHLRVLLEDLCIALAKHLGHPFISHAARAEPGCVSRAEVVYPKIRNFRARQGLVPDGFERRLVPRFIWICCKARRANLMGREDESEPLGIVFGGDTSKT